MHSVTVLVRCVFVVLSNPTVSLSNLTGNDHLYIFTSYLLAQTVRKYSVCWQCSFRGFKGIFFSVGQKGTLQAAEIKTQTTGYRRQVHFASSSFKPSSTNISDSTHGETETQLLQPSSSTQPWSESLIREKKHRSALQKAFWCFTVEAFQVIYLLLTVNANSVSLSRGRFPFFVHKLLYLAQSGPCPLSCVI